MSWSWPNRSVKAIARELPERLYHIVFPPFCIIKRIFVWIYDKQHVRKPCLIRIKQIVYANDDHATSYFAKYCKNGYTYRTKRLSMVNPKLIRNKPSINQLVSTFKSRAFLLSTYCLLTNCCLQVQPEKMIFVWPWNEYAQIKPEEQTNKNLWIWLTYT